MKAFKDAPKPRNVSELKSYLGLLSYYSKFLPNLSTILSPLYELLRASIKWEWKKQQEEAFLTSKRLLTSSQMLVHFDPTQEIVVSYDGAVLAHRLAEGSEKPISFASWTLSNAEKKYSQVEKEGLVCVFGIKRFHAYIYGHPFTLITDIRALLALLSPQ